jgi:hypothetical protein
MLREILLAVVPTIRNGTVKCVESLPGVTNALTVSTLMATNVSSRLCKSLNVPEEAIFVDAYVLAIRDLSVGKDTLLIRAGAFEMGNQSSQRTSITILPVESVCPIRKFIARQALSSEAMTVFWARIHFANSGSPLMENVVSLTTHRHLVVTMSILRM